MSCGLYAQSVLAELFAAEGFRCEEVQVQERRISNRLRALDMDRRWIQGVFTHTGAPSAPGMCQACPCA